MKRKIDLVEEESEHEEGESSGDESEDEEPRVKEEPRIKDVLDIFPAQYQKCVLLICCIVWPLPKIFSSGFPADNYFEIKIPFPSQTSPS